MAPAFATVSAPSQRSSTAQEVAAEPGSRTVRSMRNPGRQSPGAEPPGLSLRGVRRVSTGPEKVHTRDEGRVISAPSATALGKAPGPEGAGTDRNTFRVPASRVRLMLTPARSIAVPGVGRGSHGSLATVAVNAMSTGAGSWSRRVGEPFALTSGVRSTDG
jgi:hypothetical protein